MLNRTAKTVFFASAIAGALTTGGTIAASELEDSAIEIAEDQPAFEIDLNAGEVLQVFAPDAASDGANARQEFYQSVLPLVEQDGFQRLGQLNVRQTVVSEYEPGAFIFFSWPDLASSKNIESDPQWPSIQALRREGWDALNIYSVVLEEDLQLQFDHDKHYTVVVAWLNEETGEDYSRYLAGIAPAVERAGGRFIYKMHSPTMETLSGQSTAPGQITFVEWETPDGFAQVQQSPEYRANQSNFASGVERFEFYWLKTRS